MLQRLTGIKVPTRKRYAVQNLLDGLASKLFSDSNAELVAKQKRMQELESRREICLNIF